MNVGKEAFLVQQRKWMGMAIAAIACSTVLVLAPPARAEDDDWTEEEMAFVEGCQEGGAPEEVCICFIDTLAENGIDLETLVADIESGDDEEYTEYMENCMEE